MATRRMLKSRKGQFGGDRPLTQLKDYVMSWLTGARGLQAPVSIRYLFVGDSAIIGRMRRDAQLEKNLRHKLEAELKNFESNIKRRRSITDPAQQDQLEQAILDSAARFADDLKQDLAYVTDIAKQDASLIGELGGYDKVLGRFLVQIQKEGFPQDKAQVLWHNLARLSQAFQEDAKRILATAQSEYRGTTSLGLFSYKTSDTLDNMVRRIARMINNVHNQILEELNTLREAETRADIGDTEQHANRVIQLMDAELNLIKTVVENDQVLLARLTDVTEAFKKKAWVAVQTLSGTRKAQLQALVRGLELALSSQLQSLRRTAQQIEFEAQQLTKAA